jgi:Skp family chaperone for outer membrane proteins
MSTIALFRTTALSGILLFSFASMAQDEPPPMSEERMQEIKAMKSAYLTSRMGLTPEEAQRFWPVYNQYDAELEAIRKESFAVRRSVKRSAEQMTEAEAAKLIDSELAVRQKELDIRKKYAEIFKKGIGAVKTAELYRAEHEFNRELLRRYKDQEGGTGPGGQKGPRGR